MKGYLLIRAGGDRYGLPIGDVVEVVDDAATEPVPGGLPAVLGVARIRGRMVPVIHLGALLTDCAPSERERRTVVVTRCGARRVAFEVDDADAVVRDIPIPAPPDRKVPWASGVARQDEALIPILDMDMLDERLAVRSGEATP
jgi:chemotaxis signal transduction protein